MYEVFISEYGSINIRRQNVDGSITWIPSDDSNADYQQYLIDTDGGLPIPTTSK